MRIALVNATPNAKMYPLGLLKIGAWRKHLGDECALFMDDLPAPGDFDQIWVSTLFTFDQPHALGIINEAMKRASRVWVGGIASSLIPEPYLATGADVHMGLLQEAEGFAPDYSLLRHPPQYSIAYTSRGCVRKCPFCMVPKLEPDFQDRPAWPSDLNDSNRIMFYDNNWLAKPMDKIVRDVREIRALIEAGQISKVDFNQGLDCRLLTDDHVDLLRGLPMKPIRFAFDGMQEDGSFQRAITAMAQAGHKVFINYTLYNFTDRPTDFYYRLREQARLTEELGVMVCAFPMRYQPILDADTRREYVGRHWTMPQRKGFMALLSQLSIAGQVSFHSLEDFEFWFGQSEAEFAALLAYPRIRELAAKRAGEFRLRKARAR